MKGSEIGRCGSWAVARGDAALAARWLVVPKVEGMSWDGSRGRRGHLTERWPFVIADTSTLLGIVVLISSMHTAC